MGGGCCCCSCCCCAFIIVTLAAKGMMAIATTADINPTVIAGGTNDREDTLIMLGTKYRFQSNKGSFGTWHKISIIRQFLTSMTNDSKKKDYTPYTKITIHPKTTFVCLLCLLPTAILFLLITKVLLTYPHL
jgi:hypothetical protein